jgi:hypothetical protein
MAKEIDMAVRKAVAKKTVTKKVTRKPTKAKARVDAGEKKINATLRNVAAEIDAAEIDAAEPYSTDAEIDDLLKKADKIVAKKKPMGVSNVRRADNAGEVLTTIDASNLVDDVDEFGVGYMSFEESDELDAIEKENRAVLKTRPDWSVNGSLPKKTRQQAELQSLKEEIEVLKKDLEKTNALLLDSERKLTALMKPKEPWYISLFRTEDVA